MTAAVFDLQAVAHPSRILAAHIAATPGAAQRAGLEVATPQNAGAGASFATSSDNDAMRALFQPLTGSSGFAVTDFTAMTVSAVYACMTVIAGAVLQLPVDQYRVGKDGRRDPMEPTPLWWLLNEQPDDAWTAASWKRWIVRCIGLRGDHVTQILRDPRVSAGGSIVGLRPHHPDTVNMRRNGHRIAYDIFDRTTSQVITLDQDDVLHFPGFGFDGLRSQSVVQWAARNAIGNALAATDFMGRTVGEGAMPQIAIKFPNKINKDQAQNLREAFVATYTGTGARKLPLVLAEGAEVQELALSPVDLQLIESRKMEKGDICEAFGVPPVLIGQSEKTSSWGTGIEQITLGFVKFTIAPMLRGWEEELNRKLFRRAGMFLNFNLDALLRGDSKARADANRAALGGPGTGDGYQSVDEIRRSENLPPLGGEYAVPFRAQRGNTGATPTDPKAPAP